MLRYLLASLCVISASCAHAQGPETQSTSWCNEVDAPISDDWGDLPSSELIALRPAEIARAQGRLRDVSVVPLSMQEARDMMSAEQRPAFGRFYLVRAGVMLEPGLEAEQASTRFFGSVSRRLHWSRRLGAIAIGSIAPLSLQSLTVSTTPRRPLLYNVPVLLNIDVIPERVFVNCLSTIH